MPLYPFIILGIAVYLRRSVKIREYMASFFARYSLRKTVASLIVLLLVSFTGYILLVPVLNSRNSAVDLCSKLNDIIDPNDTLVTYRYSRPYIVFYLNQGHVAELNDVTDIQHTLDHPDSGTHAFALLQKKDFLALPSLSSYRIVLEYPNFTKKNNDMVLITASQEGEDS